MNEGQPQTAPGTPVDTAEPVFHDSDKKTTPTGLIIGMVLLALIAIGGVAFGVWEMVSQSQKVKDLETQVANCANANSGAETETETVTCPDGTSMVIAKNAMDNASAQTIADPYLVNFGAFDNILDHDFDVDNKIKIAFDNLGANKVVAATMVDEWAITVKYDDLNNKYKYLFGSDQEIEKRDYNLLHGDYLYTEERGGQFKVKLGGIGGTGGTMFSVVKEARYEEGILVVKVYHDAVSWCESEDQIGSNYCVKPYSAPKSEAIQDLIENFADNIPVYTMTFTKDDGHYMLKNIQKQQ